MFITMLSEMLSRRGLGLPLLETFISDRNFANNTIENMFVNTILRLLLTISPATRISTIVFKCEGGLTFEPT
jgi:hypothetical protein